MEDAVASVGQLFRERGVVLELALPPSAPPVFADRDRVLQVLLNLLSNAAKFCAPGAGRAVMTLSVAADALRIDVADNGPGISADDQAIIFDKFRQVGDTLTQKPHGSGLGLSICRQIVGHLGGRLWVESRVGQGASFSFTLPLARAPEAPAPAAAPALA
jgi:signal transduction histidine kinase